MKRVCLDTDFLVALLREHPVAIKKAEEYDYRSTEVSTTSVSAFEIYLGAFRSGQREKNLKAADDLLNSVQVLDLTQESSRKSAEILSELLSWGEPIGLRDALIAGTALASGSTLITRNIEHFKRVSGLGIEPW